MTMSALFRSACLAALLLAASAYGVEVIDDHTAITMPTALSIFGAAFGAWAVLLGWVLAVLRREFSELKSYVMSEASRRVESELRAHQDRVQIERRLAEIEVAMRIRHENHQ